MTKDIVTVNILAELMKAESEGADKVRKVCEDLGRRCTGPEIDKAQNVISDRILLWRRENDAELCSVYNKYTKRAEEGPHTTKQAVIIPFRR